MLVAVYTDIKLNERNTIMVRKYYYDELVYEPDEEGNVIIIHKDSIAPIESFTYGITKERMLNTLKNEIVILKNEGTF